MIFAWVSLFIFLGTPAMAADPTLCGRAFGELTVHEKRISILDRLRKIAPELAEALNNVHQLNPNLVSGKAIPKWQDLELLESTLRSIKAGKAKATESGTLPKLNEIIPHLVDFVQSDETHQAITAAGGLKAAKPERYKPTEYELKRLYQAKLWEINRELPPPLKIRGARIPFDQRRNTLVAEARVLIKAQEKNYQSLYPSTGFPNREALIEAIKKQSPEAEAVLAMLEKEDVEFVMRRPEGARWWIPKVGFQNQRVSGSSRGNLSPHGRDTAEAFLTFGKKSEFEKLDNDLKPKYGYLRPKPGQFLVEDRITTSIYGDDFFIFKKNNLRDRTTWTAGDSLGRGMYKEETDVPQVWHDAFTPWSNRELLAPVLLPHDMQDKTFRVYHPYFDEKSPLGPFAKKVPNTVYPELQYWGPVMLDDVEAFEFSNNPPSGEFLEELLKRNIKIRDASGGSPVDWHPPGRAEK